MTSLLLDTHLLVWAADGDRRLPHAARMLIEDADNELLFSTVSVWEVAIKWAARRGGPLPEPRRFRLAMEAAKYSELAITTEHVLATADLPRLHGDPFDRLLLAQARVEGLLLVTVDSQLARYPGPIRLVT